MRDDPLAFFITWTCYGTWMPGDDRGWTRWHKGDQLPQPRLATWCRDRLVEPPVRLEYRQRQLVNRTVVEHCQLRRWLLHAVNCRSNHCHVVVTAVGYSGEQVRDQLKAWASRCLNEDQRLNAPHLPARKRWWSRKGSVRYLFDEEAIGHATFYTRELQDPENMEGGFG